jgi:toxin YoeB
LARAGREAAFDPEFLADLRYGVKTDRGTALRLLDLVDAVLREPVEGIGKPEPLRFELRGCWSRRITQEHRIVYLKERGRIAFLQARNRY